MQGAVSAVHEDSSLWPEGLETVGSISQTAKVLAELDGKTWMWFGTEADTQFLLISPQSKDPDARLIRAQIRVIAHHFSAEPTQCFGVLSQMQSGALSFVTDSPIEQWFESFQRWFDAKSADRIDSLNALRVVQVFNGEMIGFKILGGQTSPQENSLGALREIMLAIPAQKDVALYSQRKRDCF